MSPWVKEDKFPKPIKLSPRITVYEEEKIDYWMNDFMKR
ncbi:helix-turn-helix transcriptional regulator [Poseidonibacter lekithochrous]|nr:AlpA family phage regulatory protein [Poseidonibacter lekithochrous]